MPFLSTPRTVPIPSTIPPKGEIESNHFDISGSDLIDIRDGKKYFYIWGVARYRDVFPATIEHVTKFCVVASGVTGDPKKAFDSNTNPVEILCADEDCGPTPIAPRTALSRQREGPQYRPPLQANDH
jgi:hypothetical protein